MNVIIEDSYLKGLLPCGTIRTYHEKETIYLQDYKADKIYVVISGRVRVYAVSPKGDEITFEVLRKGRIFGDTSFVTNCRYLVNVEAVMDSHILVTDTSRLIPVLMKNRYLLEKVLAYLSESCNSLTRKVIRSSFLDASHSVADLLLELSRNSSVVTYTHEQLAATLGKNRVTVSRCMAVFCKNGWIEEGYGRIVILDRKALTAYCH